MINKIKEFLTNFIYYLNLGIVFNFHGDLVLWRWPFLRNKRDRKFHNITISEEFNNLEEIRDGWWDRAIELTWFDNNEYDFNFYQDFLRSEEIENDLGKDI